MKLKTGFFDGTHHTDVVTALSWNSNEELSSCGDDHVLMKWNLMANEGTVVAQLPQDLFPTSLHWFPKANAGPKKAGSELLVIGSADGKYHFVNQSGRFDRSVEAHQGAVLIAIWSWDGAGLLTAGEDGQVKIWSRSGMLRSTVISGDVPVYTAAWGPQSNQILIAQGNTLLHKPLAPNTKPNRWRAHEGLILKVAWNQTNGLIVSAGEDCRYKVWDGLGRVLYTSHPHEHPITALAWTPKGEAFAVASFNSLRLCDRVGWSHSLEKVPTGAIYDLAWSSDGTQLAGACANGRVILAHVIDWRAAWKNFEVTVDTRESVVVRNVVDETEDRLEVGERVAKIALGFHHLVLTTATQCRIYATSNLNTPVIVPLRGGSPSHVALTYKLFLLIERNNINIYGYDGKLHSSPKLAGIQMDVMDEATISLAPDTLAVLDQIDAKSVHLIDLSSNRQMVELPSINHSQLILQVTLSQTGGPADRLVAFIDVTRDAYVFGGVRGREPRRPTKIAAMVSCVVWSADAVLLATIRDTVLTIWCCPQALHMDTHLLRKTTFTRDLSDIGRGVTVVSFVGNLLTLRRCDGSVVNQAVPPYIAALLAAIEDDKWDQALRLCRFINEDLLWASLACLSCLRKDLATAEEAFAAINELDKVAYIQHIKCLPLQPARSAYTALLAGNAAEAENILLTNGLVFRTIMLLVDTYQWTRALELAIKHRTHVDSVLFKRKVYLDALCKTETIEKFIDYQKEVELDVDAIKDKIATAFEKEKLSA